MSRGMTSSIFQNLLVSQILELKHKISNHLQTPGGSTGQFRGKNTHLFYIDDLNTAPSNPEGGKFGTDLMIDLLCLSLMPLSAIFQLYHCYQF